MKKLTGKNKGFSLLELLATIVIISVVASISTAFYLNTIKTSKEQATILAINSLKQSAELYSKENDDNLKWNYITDMNGNKKGFYMCVSVQQLINKGFFKDNFFKKDIYEDKINANSFVEIRKSLQYGEYDVKINNKAKNVSECELSMSSFKISDEDNYTDRISFSVNSNNISGIKVSASDKAGSCDGDKCIITGLKDNSTYPVGICVVDDENKDENFCEFINMSTAKFRDTNIEFEPNIDRYYYRNVSIKYNDKIQKIYGSFGRYFKLDVGGIIDNKQIIYKCNGESYLNCDDKANSIEAGVLYKVDDDFYNKNSNIEFSIITDVNDDVNDKDKKYVHTYLVDLTSNVGEYKKSVLPIKTTFNVNYINACNGVDDVIVRDVCKYGYKCVLSDKINSCLGYNFNGWKLENSDSVLTGNYFTQNDMLPEDEVNYYANWAPISYNIKYNLKGGSFGREHPDVAIYDKEFRVDNPVKTIKFVGNSNNTSGANGTGVTITDNNKSVVQTFKGWDLIGADDSVLKTTSVIDTNFKNLRSSAGDVNFIAKWDSVIGSLPKVTKDGYTCGWNTNSTGTTIEYFSGANYIENNVDFVDGSTINLYAVCQRVELATYPLDLNGILDGNNTNDLGSYGTADIYVNGNRVANDVNDFYNNYVVGTTYEIKDIKSTTGHHYVGSNISGTINGITSVRLTFNTNVCTVSYSANGGSFSKNSDKVSKVKYNEYLGGEHGILNPVDTFGATKSNSIPYPGRQWVISSKYYDQTKKYKAQDICSGLGAGDSSAILKVNWYKRCSNVVNKTGLKVYHWNHALSECSDKSKLRRYYNFSAYDCTCSVDTVSHDNKTCNVSVSSDLAAVSHQSSDSKWNHRAVIQYNNSDNGQKACKGSNGYKVNYYVSKVCSDGPVNTRKGKDDSLFFHGYMFYDYGSGAHNNFNPSDYWTHNLESMMDNRIKSSNGASAACLHVCKLRYS